MAKNNKIQLYRTETNGATTTDIIKGELALNINSSSPFVMFKDASGAVQKVGSLSTSTGSSVYHTMTQKAITDALTARKGDTDALALSLNSEISARTNADTALSDRITDLENSVGGSITTQITEAIEALNSNITGNGTHVDVTINQTNGKISSVNISENDIASASALSTETTNRTNTDNKIISSVGLNSDGTFKVPTTAQTSGYTTAATSILDAIIMLDNQVEENETVTAYALTDLNNRLEELVNWCSYMSGFTTTTSLSNVPTTKRLCVATITSSQALGINKDIADGRELHIIVYNNSSSEITISISDVIIGSSNEYNIINMNGENLTISAKSYGEINLISSGGNLYYRGVSS